MAVKLLADERIALTNLPLVFCLGVTTLRPTAMKSSVSSSDQVANTILHAVKCGDPDMQYVIGNDATDSIRTRKSLSDREFTKWTKDGRLHGKGFAR
jgi:hypothetical protein